MNANQLFADALQSLIPGMTSDIQMVLVWGVGCTVAVVAIGLLRDVFDQIRAGGTDQEVTEGKIFREYQRGGGRANNYDRWTEKQHMKEAEKLFRKHRGGKK